MTEHELRRRNLAALIGTERGAIADFAEKVGYSDGYISQLLSGHRNIGEKVARKIEKAIGVRTKLLDETDPQYESNGAIEDIESALRRADWLTPESREQIVGLVKALRSAKS